MKKEMSQEGVALLDRTKNDSSTLYCDFQFPNKMVDGYWPTPWILVKTLEWDENIT